MVQYIDDIVIDCSGLDGAASGLLSKPDLTLGTPRTRRGPVVWIHAGSSRRRIGHTITGKDWTVAVHTFAALMEAIPQCFKIWERVTGIRAATIAQSYLTLGATRRIPAHCHLSHDNLSRELRSNCCRSIQLQPVCSVLAWLGSDSAIHTYNPAPSQRI